MLAFPINNYEGKITLIQSVELLSAYFEKVDSDVVSPEVIPTVAENIEYAYGSEVFDEFQKQQINKETSSNIVDRIFTTDSMKR